MTEDNSHPKDPNCHCTVAEPALELPLETQIAHTAVADILQFLGEDPTREGLAATPGRFIRALQELTAGYHLDPQAILSTCFSEKSDHLVILRNVEFYSTCEHHLLSFAGTATVAYLPDGKVVGLSKLARLVGCFARRLQIQERLTGQIADALETHLKARAVGVVITAHHSCMGCRGVHQPRAQMITSDFRGLLRSDALLRQEFYAAHQ